MIYEPGTAAKFSLGQESVTIREPTKYQSEYQQHFHLVHFIARYMDKKVKNLLQYRVPIKVSI